jgi:hypothetical protein
MVCKIWDQETEHQRLDLEFHHRLLTQMQDWFILNPPNVF